MIDDHYKILGVPSGATEDVIRRAYRKLILRRHPDKTKNGSSEMFRKIRTSYDILKDPEKKQKYDGLKKPTEDQVTQRVRKGEDLRTHLVIKTEDLAQGLCKVIQINRKGHCPACEGTGSPSKTLDKCSKCQGSGIDYMSTILGPRQLCRHCKGLGSFPSTVKCLKCSGSGLINETIKREIELSPYLTTPLIFKGAGNYCLGGSAGDLIVEIKEKKSRALSKDGLDVKGTIELSPAQAVLGDKISMDVFGETIVFDVPPRTQHDTIIEMKDGGIAWKNKRGKFIAQMKIKVPDKIDREELDLYKKLLKKQKKENENG